MRHENKIWQDIDWMMIFMYLIIVLLGVVTIYSADFNEKHAAIFDLQSEHGKQLMWIGISIFLGLIIMLLDSSFIQKQAYIFYGITLVLLVLVLFTEPINGARAWFGVGSIGIQPAEFAKLGVALALAKHLPDLNPMRKRNYSSGQGFKFTNIFNFISALKYHWKTILILFIPAILVLLQPDAGTFIVFTSFILVLYREGYSGNILLFLIVAVIIAVITLVISDTSFFLPFTKIKLSGKAGIFLFIVFIGSILFVVVKYLVKPRDRKTLYKAVAGSMIVSMVFVYTIEGAYSKVLQTHQKERIDLLLGKIDDPDGKGYNINRSKAAIGSGRFFGKGYKKAQLANANQKHVPMQSTDFIFCTWSEERGFLGSSILVILYIIFLIKSIIIAERQKSIFSRVFAYSFASIVFYHFMINIGMAIGLAPVIGIPLPFFSYGGSSFLAFSIMFFIMIKLDSERKYILK